MRFALITAAALSAGLLVGCKDDSTTSKPPAQPTTQATTQPSAADKAKADMNNAAANLKEGASDAAGDVKEGASKAAGDVKEGASTTGEKIKEGAKDIGDKAKDLTKEGADKVKEGAAKVEDAADKNAEGGMTAKVREEAQKYYDQAMAAVKKKDFSAAESAVEKLEKLRPQLSPEWQGKLDSLKSSIETAKKAGDVKIPGTSE